MKAANSLRELLCKLQIQVKENFTENSTKLNEIWNFSTTPQKLLKSKELCILDSLSDK